MKGKRYLLFVLCCLFLCFGVVYAASASAAQKTKEILINQLKKDDLQYRPGQISQLNQTSSGNVKFSLKHLGGSTIFLNEDFKDFRGLSDTTLDLDYRLDAPQEKMELSYDLYLRQDIYQGSVYLHEDMVIFTTDALFQVLQSGLFSELTDSHNTQEFLTDPENLPAYLYLSAKDIGLWPLWETAFPKSQDIDPAVYKQLAIFILEAIPDQYYSVSLRNQNIVIDLDEAALSEVISAVAHKCVNEPERFADIILPSAYSLYPDIDLEEIKAELVDSLKQAEESGIPDPAEIKDVLAAVFVLEQMRFEMSPLSGDSSFIIAGSVADNPDLAGKVSLDVSAAAGGYSLNGSLSFASKEGDQLGSAVTLDCHANVTNYEVGRGGTYTISATVNDQTDDNFAFKCAVNGTFEETLTSITTHNVLKANAKDQSDDYLNLWLEINSEDRVDPDVIIDIPLLTPDNSMHLHEMMSDLYDDNDLYDHDADAVYLNDGTC